MSTETTKLELITDIKLLRIKAKKVSKWSGERAGRKLMRFIVDNGIECIGMAAPQVGIDKRVFVLFDGKEFAIFINPKLVTEGPMVDTQIEGCLSLPGEKYKVTRATSIVVKDAVRTQPYELQGWTARAWLHEYDHLNGILISDKRRGIKVDDENETAKFTL